MPTAPLAPTVAPGSCDGTGTDTVIDTVYTKVDDHHAANTPPESASGTNVGGDVDTSTLLGTKTRPSLSPSAHVIPPVGMEGSDHLP